jgi:splicing factor 3B subunit 2
MTSVVSTVAGGLETPDFLDLRKSAAVRAVPDMTDSGPKQLYQVVPEKQTAIRGLMGSERGYDVAGLAHGGGSGIVPVLGQEQRGPKRKGGVEVSIDASELEGMSEDQLKRHYAEASRSGSGSGVHVPGGREDFSDMVVENTKKQRQKQDNKKREKEKDFKF